jgi:hypothetical protein
MDPVKRWPTPLDYLVVTSLFILALTLILVGAVKDDASYLRWLTPLAVVSCICLGTAGNPKR